MMDDKEVLELEGIGSKKEENPTPTKKRAKGARKYALYVSLVLVATSLSLFLTLRGRSQDIAKAFSNTNGAFIWAIAGIMLLNIFIDGLIIMIFMRLYTRKYHINEGMAVSLIGTFYSGITPGTKGGQVMQAYTLKKQGSQISNAASLLVMYFILYNTALIIFDILAVIFKSELMTTLMIKGHIGVWEFELPLAPLTIIGFIVNVSIIGILFTMSYSHKFHNLVMHYGVGLLARLRILKDPNKTRESLRIQVENFKIELRRLFSNVRVTLLILILFLVSLVAKFSIPWFAGMALNAYQEGGATIQSFWDTCFMSGYHQMITGLFPIPGGAGVSELFFSSLFDNYFAWGDITYTSSVLLIWRSATYYVLVIIAGIVTGTYKASPKEKALEVDRSEFVTIQLETYEERKISSDTLYKTSQMSRKELQNRLKDVLTPKSKKEKDLSKYYKLDDSDINEGSPFIIDDEFIPTNIHKKKKKRNNDIDWRDLNIK